MALYDTPQGQIAAVKKLLLEDGWCQGVYQQGTARSLVSALGAVSAGPLRPVIANGVPVTVFDQETKKQTPLSNRSCVLNQTPLWQALCVLLGVPLIDGLQGWNDLPSTTLQAVLGALDEALAQL